MVLLHCPLEIIVGFPYEEITFEASAVENVMMIVFGEARQSFVVNFIQGTVYVHYYIYFCTCTPNNLTYSLIKSQGMM